MRDRSIGSSVVELGDDAANVADVNAFAGVRREAALQKAALGHRRLLGRARSVRQPVAVHDDESVAIGQALERSCV